MDINNDKTLQALATSINFRQMRQKLISSNIANSETPGYKAKRIDFEEALARALDIDKTNSLNVENSKHYNVGGGGFDNLEPNIYNDPNDVVNDSGNTVDVEDEMSKMAENEIMFNAAVQLLNKKLALRKYILNSEK
ncbi:MAG: flagellar basal body rod protein FlgB [Halobacteriovoraceae bacterium]|nr:flagellar basal body rod protein FlgB [Halobacteriovoraceae bacterium]MCB9095930.1 flagellar basal body rod protein FlgB [Halobacteriovoraceae bacterium]